MASERCLLCMCLLVGELLALGRGTNDERRNKPRVESRSVTSNAQVLYGDIFN